MSSETRPEPSGFRRPTLAEYAERPPHPDRREGGSQAPPPPGFGPGGKPLISVITVVFNGAKTLERTLLSVKAQTYPGIEYVVVDGASRDGTLGLLEKHKETVTRWISEPDGGIYDAMNKGLALSRGDWILFLNADDLLAGPGILADLVESGIASGECDILMGSTLYFSGDRFLHTARSVPALVGRELCINHTSTLQRRALFERFGLYSPDFKIISDNEWFYRVLVSPSVRSKTVDTVVSHMNLEGFSDRRWAAGYFELHRMRRAYGMPASKAYPLLAYQCARTYVRKSLERMKLASLVRVIRNRTSRINRYG